MPPQIICGREHRTFESKNAEKMENIFSAISSKDLGSAVLGLHKTNKGICPGDYIGVVWVGAGKNRIALRVDSKFEKMDYISMFTECCNDAVVGSRVQKCFEVWPHEELIDIRNDKHFSFMVVAAFLQELNTLCTRHLRRHFHRHRENFIGKVKGKIIIGENLRRNIGHAERMFCEYQAISSDILENRILRAALEKASRYLSAEKKAKEYEVLQRWVHACRAHLHNVSVKHIARRDFGEARHRGAFAPYLRPLHLAKAVLCHFGFNPHAEQGKITKTPPYAINSFKLFECYTELRLRKTYPNIVVQSKEENPRGGFSVNIYPDFYVPQLEDEHGKSLIIDAKYKEIDNGEKPEGSDIYQVVAYSQHLGLSRALNRNNDNKENTDVELCLAYPWVKGRGWPQQAFTEAFTSKIRLCKIECPAVSDSKE